MIFFGEGLDGENCSAFHHHLTRILQSNRWRWKKVNSQCLLMGKDKYDHVVKLPSGSYHDVFSKKYSSTILKPTLIICTGQVLNSLTSLTLH